VPGCGQSHAHWGSAGGQTKENQKRRLSSLKVPNTISLTPFQCMRFDKEIKALLQAIPIPQCKYSLKTATSRGAFISMSLLKKNCENLGKGVEEILLKHSHTG
jgi:hypothetical protein